MRFTVDFPMSHITEQAVTGVVMGMYICCSLRQELGCDRGILGMNIQDNAAIPHGTERSSRKTI